MSLLFTDDPKPKMYDTGRKFEQMLRTLLEHSDWHVGVQYPAGFRLGKKTKHIVDIHAEKHGTEREILISCKYQQTSGSTSDKLPYEYMCLLRAVEENMVDRGFIVLFGKEAAKGNMFLPEKISEFEKYMTVSRKIKVCSFEEFTELTNKNKLCDLNA